MSLMIDVAVDIYKKTQKIKLATFLSLAKIASHIFNSFVTYHASNHTNTNHPRLTRVLDGLFIIITLS